MAWTTPRTWVANEVPTAAIMNTHIRDNLNFIADEPHELWLSRSSVQSISNTTQTAISWNSEQRDVGFGFTPTSATITVQQTGIYSIVGNVQWAGTAGGLFGYVGIDVGGTQYAGLGGACPVNNEGNQKGVSLTLRIAASTTVQMFVYQNTGGAIDAQPQSGGSAGTCIKIAQVQRTTS